MTKSRTILMSFMSLFAVNTFAQTSQKLVWSDEFDGNEQINTATWNFEEGFVRNQEDQWYHKDNAYIENGLLVLEARLDSFPNPNYSSSSRDWRRSRPYVYYTSASINTQGKFKFLYGRLEVRARIPAVKGAWPAIWTLGENWEWPSGGEIDIMEFYQVENAPHILANAAWGNDQRYNAVWNSTKTPYSHFLEKDSDWGEKFHIWAMDWSEDSIVISLDGEVLNSIDMSKVKNGKLGDNANPFKTPQYILLNLAVGGVNGGEPQRNAFPMRYEIDYVRVYQ